MSFLLLVVLSACVSAPAKVRIPDDRSVTEGSHQAKVVTPMPVAVAEKPPVIAVKPAPAVPDIAQEPAVPHAQTEAAAEPPPSSSSEEIRQRGGGHQKPLLPDYTFLQQRQSAYVEIREQWHRLANHFVELQAGPMPDRWQHCLDRLETLVSGYQSLMQWVADNEQQGAAIQQWQGVDPWPIIAADLTFVTGSCNAVQKEAIDRLDARLTRLTTANAGLANGVVDAYAGAKDFAAVVRAYGDLERHFGDHAISDTTRQQYVQALLRQGELARAATVEGSLLEERGSSAALLLARRRYADLLLATGQLRAAREQYAALAAFYGQIADNEDWVHNHLAFLDQQPVPEPLLSLYQGVLTAYLAFDGQHIPANVDTMRAQLAEHFSGSPLSVYAQDMVTEMESRVEIWTEEQLAQARALIEEKRFAQARKILDGLDSATLTMELRDDVAAAGRELQARKEEEQRLYQQQQQAMLEERWRSALALVDQQQYDQAIAAFSALLTTEYADQAAAQIRQTTNLAAVRQRSRAASLFLKARKSQDPVRKKKLLLESWRLLDGVRRQYPEADLIDKIKQNMGVLERQLDQLDPGWRPANLL